MVVQITSEQENILNEIRTNNPNFNIYFGPKDDGYVPFDASKATTQTNIKNIEDQLRQILNLTEKQASFLANQQASSTLVINQATPTPLSTPIATASPPAMPLPPQSQPISATSVQSIPSTKPSLKPVTESIEKKKTDVESSLMVTGLSIVGKTSSILESFKNKVGADMALLSVPLAAYTLGALKKRFIPSITSSMLRVLPNALAVGSIAYAGADLAMTASDKFRGTKLRENYNINTVKSFLGIDMMETDIAKWVAVFAKSSNVLFENIIQRSKPVAREIIRSGIRFEKEALQTSSRIKSFISRIGSELSNTSLYQKISTLTSTAGNRISQIISNVGTNITNAISSTKNLLSKIPNIKAVTDPIVAFSKSVFNSVSGGLKGIVNYVGNTSLYKNTEEYISSLFKRIKLGTFGRFGRLLKGFSSKILGIVDVIQAVNYATQGDYYSASLKVASLVGNKAITAASVAFAPESFGASLVGIAGATSFSMWMDTLIASHRKEIDNKAKAAAASAPATQTTQMPSGPTISAAKKPEKSIPTGAFYEYDAEGKPRIIQVSAQEVESMKPQMSDSPFTKPVPLTPKPTSTPKPEVSVEVELPPKVAEKRVETSPPPSAPEKPPAPVNIINNNVSTGTSKGKSVVVSPTPVREYRERVYERRVIRTYGVNR